MEEILSSANLCLAYKSVKENRGAAGIDGRDIESTFQYLRSHWGRVSEKLWEGSYNPSPVKGVVIPKPDGGKRQLGIPTVQDRVIQQAIQQVLSHRFEEHFSEHSYGFRPKRSAHDAIRAAAKYVHEGNNWVVDIDIHAFFDYVNHDILLNQALKVEKDQRILHLLRKYLRADVITEGKREKRLRGTPQGGPISPLLGNIYLDQLDKELEKRGLSFCRYADDITIYVKSERSAQRVLKSIVKWIESRLKLKVNIQKSGIGRPWKRQFLGFNVKEDGGVAISLKSIERFKVKVRTLWDARQSLTSKELFSQWQKYIRGWWNYYKLAGIDWRLRSLESWTRRHVRKCFWLRWHNRKGRRNALRRLGLTFPRLKVASFPGGAWRVARSPSLQSALNNSVLYKYGLLLPSILST